MEETYSAPQAHEVRSEAGRARVESERHAALPSDHTHTRGRLMQSFLTVRRTTEKLASRLSPEDQCLQSMPDCSPAKWHRAHTTWFFEEFLLVAAGFPRYCDEYAYLFNSYYETAGARHPRPQRGILSRPSAGEVSEYRRVVDERVLAWLERLHPDTLDQVAPLLELGVAHEQQHQELLLTDVLHAFSLNPLKPAYLPCETSTVKLPGSVSTDTSSRHASARETQRASLFEVYAGGVAEIGAASVGFSFDNERPRHRVYIEPFELATRPIIMSEVKAFIEAGGYATASLWLAEGLEWVRRTGATAPLHSRLEDGEMLVFSLRGEQTAADNMIAGHLNYYEADAIARFLGARLPTEGEWEIAAAAVQNAAGERAVQANWLESERLMPSLAGGLHTDSRTPQHLFGDVWEWTSSAYCPYPGYAPAPGAIGEYNGKFMVNQLVLRGGSCLTPAGHIRPTYRNFWPAMTSFQMTGGRLARSVK